MSEEQFECTMRRFRKLSALLLLGMFVFPIFFQPLHVIWHVSKEALPSCVGTISTPIKFQSTDAHAYELTSVQTHCLACAFTFITKSLPANAPYTAVLTALVTTLMYDSSVETPSLVLQSTSSRAPPIWILA
jgi:hypothetical protein